MSRSDGSYLVDSRGRRYVDFLMGWCVGSCHTNDLPLDRKAADKVQTLLKHRDIAP